MKCHDLRRRDAQHVEQRLQQGGKGGFADPAQAQRRQRDTQLAGRQVGVEFAVHRGQDAAAQALCFCDGAHAGAAQSNDTEFSCNKETVQRDQEQGEQNE
jgi:hypothetical protein